MSQLLQDAQETEIDGFKFRMSAMDPFTSDALLMDVLKMVGPALGHVLDQIKMGKGDEVSEDEQKDATQQSFDLLSKASGILDAEISDGFIGKAATSLFSGLNNATLKRVTDAFMADTEVCTDGSDKYTPLAKTASVVFRGRIMMLQRFRVWGAMVQWGK